MATQPDIVLMDKDGKILKTFPGSTALEIIQNETKDIMETNKEAVLTTKKQDSTTTDRYKPLGIKVLKILKENTGKNEASNADIVKAIVIEFIKPTDYSKTIEYEFAYFNKDFLVTTSEISGTLIENDNKSTYGLTELDTAKLYYHIKIDKIEINKEIFKKNYLMQVRRKQKNDGKPSEWGTEIHTEFYINGQGTIFDKAVKVGYSTRKSTVAMAEDTKISIGYAKIKKSSMGQNLPKRIFNNKPESSLMGIEVEVSKLKYNTRNHNFNLALSVKSNQIKTDMTSYNSFVNFYNDGLDDNEKDKVLTPLNPDINLTQEIITKLSNSEKKGIEEGSILKDPNIKDKDIYYNIIEPIIGLKEKGIQIIEGIYIKEINFGLDITDENPEEQE